MSRLAALSFRATTLGINGNEALGSVCGASEGFLLFGGLVEQICRANCRA